MRRIPALLTAFHLAAPVTLFAQDGLLVVAHGANAAWNAQVRETVRQVDWPHGRVAVAFLMGDEAESAGWDAAVRELEAAGSRRIVVVPLMVSSHGSHYRQIRHYAGELADLPAELEAHNHGTAGLAAVPMRVTPALDHAPEVAVALAARWAAASGAAGSPLVLLGHGPQSEEDLARWHEAFDSYAAALRKAGYAGEIRVQFLRDDAPAPVRSRAIQDLRDTVTALAARAADSVSVMTVLIATGPMTSARIPNDIAGLPVRYLPIGVTPHPAIARWIERTAGSIAW
jgi:sirohydrochlorin ferrochelatase